MNLCKSLKIDLTRAFQNKWFPAGILLTAAVLAANLPWENMPDPSVLYLVSLIAWGSYTQMICICGVIPFGTAYLAEREHQYIRYLVFRSDIKSYLRSKVIVTVFSGFVTVFLGKLLLAGTARLFCPTVSRWEWYDPAEKGIDCLKALCPWGYVLADAFLYALAGAAFALMALLVSAVTRNVFVTVMSPMVLYFAISSVEQWFHVPQWLDIIALQRGYIAIYADSVFFTLVHITVIWAAVMFLTGMIFVRYGERRFQNE